MPTAVPQRLREEVGQHLLLYDGVCGFCDRFVQFVLIRDRRAAFRFASLQSSIAATQLALFGARAEDLDTVSVIARYQEEGAVRLTKSRAACFVLSQLGWPWRIVALVGVVPSALLDRAYDRVARHRYRFFGKHDVCRLPRAEDRHRFVDADTPIGSVPKTTR